ncbi:MAG: hypothetical protein ACRD0G_04105 [Acidimicrobiales bacterium]
MARGVPTLPEIRPGTATGVGSLPHRSAGEAVRFAFTEYDLPAIPSLPRRCPAESMIAQALVGINGVSPGQYGSIAVDTKAVDPYAPVITDIATDSFYALRRFLDVAVADGVRGTVKWQFVGPVTLGVALARAGLADDLAFAVAGRAVRSHVVSLSVAVAAALPRSPQVVVLDEPWFGELFNPGFPIAPDPAIDLLSSAMASVSGVATVGIHCCSDADVASLLAAGPDVLSIPARPGLAAAAGYLGRFLEGGGRIAWGVVPTDGPVFVSPDRHWRELTDLWGELETRGVDAELLQLRSLVTPHCGLGMHTPVVAERVCRAVTQIGQRIAAMTCDDRHA